MSVTSPQHIQPAFILLDSDDDEQARTLTSFTVLFVIVLYMSEPPVFAEWKSIRAGCCSFDVL